MEKLNELIKLSKCGIYLNINTHRDSYETVEQYFEDIIRKEDFEDIPSDLLDKMKELDTIIELQFYPDSPVGFYTVYHYDLESAIDIALETIK